MRLVDQLLKLSFSFFVIIYVETERELLFKKKVYRQKRMTTKRMLKYIWYFKLQPNKTLFRPRFDDPRFLSKTFTNGQEGSRHKTVNK